MGRGQSVVAAAIGNTSLEVSEATTVVSVYAPWVGTYLCIGKRDRNVRAVVVGTYRDATLTLLRYDNIIIIIIYPLYYNNNMYSSGWHPMPAYRYNTIILLSLRCKDVPIPL